MTQTPVYTVTKVNQYIKTLLDRDRALAGLCVRGELSNYKVYPSGHHYFSLKDEAGDIRCVMFRRDAAGPSCYNHPICKRRGCPLKQHRFWAWAAVICMVMAMVTGCKRK